MKKGMATARGNGCIRRQVADPVAWWSLCRGNTLRKDNNSLRGNGAGRNISKRAHGHALSGGNITYCSCTFLCLSILPLHRRYHRQFQSLVWDVLLHWDVSSTGNGCESGLREWSCALCSWTGCENGWRECSSCCENGWRGWSCVLGL